MIKKLGFIVKYIIIISLTVALLFLIASSLNLKVNQIGAYRFFNVLTGSMEPSIPKGSFIVVKSINKNDVKVGDIITYRGKNSSALVTHRVVDININNEYITKGDANETIDLHAVEFSRVLGRIIYHIPNLGKGILFLKENLFLVILICLIVYFSYILFLKFRS